MPEKTNIGTVVSSLNGPSPSELDFVVTSGLVHRGQFVELDYSEGTMVCMVTNVLKTNRYFERPDAVKEFEASGSRLFEQFPSHEWEYLLAQTRPLGVYHEGRLKRPSFPPSPGTGVRSAKAELLKKFLGLEEDGVWLGEVEYHDLAVTLNMSRLIKKHLAILAMSGAGKSITCRVIIEELLKREKEDGRIGIVVIDPHGEYSSFAIPNPQNAKDFSHQTTVVSGRDIKIGVPKLNVGMIGSIVSGLSPPQKRELEQVLSNLKAEMKSGLGPFDLTAVKKAVVQNKEIKENTSKVLLSWLTVLEDLRLFAKTDFPSIPDLVRPGHLTIVDLSDLTDMKKKQILVSYISQKLFSARQAKRIPPFLLVLEESHQFVPQITREENAISRRIIETIAREGRKFGAALCLVSQRPVNLSTTALANCNTHIILRVTNPYDLKHIGESSEGIDSQSERMITTLRVGEALVVGEAVNFPVFVKIRKNESPESKHEVSLEQAAREFENQKDKTKTETEEFL